jgi:hypothetical protein
VTQLNILFNADITSALDSSSKFVLAHRKNSLSSIESISAATSNEPFSKRMVSLIEVYGRLYFSLFLPHKCGLLLFKITQTATRLSHRIDLESSASNCEYSLSVVDNLLYVLSNCLYSG